MYSLPFLWTEFKSNQVESKKKSLSNHEHRMSTTNHHEKSKTKSTQVISPYYRHIFTETRTNNQLSPLMKFAPQKDRFLSKV